MVTSSSNTTLGRWRPEIYLNLLASQSSQVSKSVREPASKNNVNERKPLDTNLRLPHALPLPPPHTPAHRAGGVSLMIQHLPSICEVMGSFSITSNKENKALQCQYGGSCLQSQQLELRRLRQGDCEFRAAGLVT